MDKINDKLKILICCHKKCELPADPDGIFLPIHVGATLSQGGGLNLQRDDQVNGEPCDNISAKNASYCELTAMYWAWKNIKKLYPNLEYIGLNHYRRYFSFDEKDILFDVINRPERDIKKYNVNTKKLFSLLKKGYTIVSGLEYRICSIWNSWCELHISCDIRTVRKIIHELYPDYDEAFYTSMMRRNRYLHFNMAIMKWEDFDAYCTWLFNILFEAEKCINITAYSKNQQRVFGYISERIFNVWVLKNHTKLKRLNVYRFSDDLPNRSKLKYCVFLFRCWLSNLAARPIYKHIHDWSWLEKEE